MDSRRSKPTTEPAPEVTDVVKKSRTHRSRAPASTHKSKHTSPPPDGTETALKLFKQTFGSKPNNDGDNFFSDPQSSFKLELMNPSATSKVNALKEEMNKAGTTKERKRELHHKIHSIARDAFVEETRSADTFKLSSENRIRTDGPIAITDGNIEVLAKTAKVTKAKAKKVVADDPTRTAKKVVPITTTDGKIEELPDSDSDKVNKVNAGDPTRTAKRPIKGETDTHRRSAITDNSAAASAPAPIQRRQRGAVEGTQTQMTQSKAGTTRARHGAKKAKAKPIQEEDSEEE